MFKTFRSRLLFWFLVFISSSLVTILLSLAYISQREQIFKQTENIAKSYFAFLKSNSSQKDFFSFEIINPTFFATGESAAYQEYSESLDSVYTFLASVHYEKDTKIAELLREQKHILKTSDSIFIYVTQKIKERGFKDYGLVGEMRKDAHWLERCSLISKTKTLTLRRHEKDFFLRNDTNYIANFIATSNSIEQNLASNFSKNSSADSALQKLESYRSNFISVVDIGKEIGIRDNTGLKKQLDNQSKDLENRFRLLVQLSNAWAKSAFDKLTLYFGITIVLLVIISILISAYIAHRITKPLRDLTSHITLFVKSNFTLEKDHPVVKSKDEIGHLTKNFSILKNEVVSQMKFFKQRVEERTIELEKANIRLEKISEANSRFVPKEFIENLGRSSIEEVELGDHVEKEMTVVFTDIRKFTEISEGLTPQENFDFMNEYLDFIIPVVEEHNGFIDKFIGDSVMSLFPHSSDDAIKAALQFQESIAKFNIHNKKKRDLPPIKTGTGIHTGKMILGTLGYGNRFETTVISDAVNTAARVERLSKFYDAPIIVTEDSILNLKHDKEIDYRFLDHVKVKGKQISIKVYQVLLREDALIKSYNDEYHNGIRLMKEKKYQNAKALFNTLIDKNPNDKALFRFVERCEKLDSGSISDFDTATQMKDK